MSDLVPEGSEAALLEALIGNRLKEFRGSRTQSELGALIGVSSTTISKWENGRVSPMMTYAGRIEKHYGAELKVLLPGCWNAMVDVIDDSSQLEMEL